MLHSSHRIMVVIGLIAIGLMPSGLSPSGVIQSALIQSASAQATDNETLKDMLAVQIRSQGYNCGQALEAKQDQQLSKPDHGVWVLKCSNATFRISRAPDMAAKVEQLP